MDIHIFNVMNGHIPAKVRGFVEEWAELNKIEQLAM